MSEVHDAHDSEDESHAHSDDRVQRAGEEAVNDGLERDVEPVSHVLAESLGVRLGSNRTKRDGPMLLSAAQIICASTTRARE